MKPPRQNKSEDFLVAFGIYGGIGFQLAISVVAGLYLGHRLDKHLNSLPYFSLGGLVLGSVAGFVNLVRVLRWKEKKITQNEHTDQPNR